MTQYNTICLIVAAGSGERFSAPSGGKLSKQYCALGGIPILRHSVVTFINHPQIDAVRVIYNPVNTEYYENAVMGLDMLSPVAGGSLRQDSVQLGLQSIAEFSPQKVLIHDAARPLVDVQIISQIINKLDKVNAAIPVFQITDTVKNCENGKIIETLPRDNLFAAQTPQGFVYKEILEAYNSVSNRQNKQKSQKSKPPIFTDEASLFEYLHKEVSIVNGSQRNLKITTNEDLKIAEALL